MQSIITVDHILPDPLCYIRREHQATRGFCSRGNTTGHGKLQLKMARMVSSEEIQLVTENYSSGWLELCLVGTHRWRAQGVRLSLLLTLLQFRFSQAPGAPAISGG